MCVIIILVVQDWHVVIVTHPTYCFSREELDSRHRQNSYTDWYLDVWRRTDQGQTDRRFYWWLIRRTPFTYATFNGKKCFVCPAAKLPNFICFLRLSMNQLICNQMSLREISRLTSFKKILENVWICQPIWLSGDIVICSLGFIF